MGSENQVQAAKGTISDSLQTILNTHGVKNKQVICSKGGFFESVHSIISANPEIRNPFYVLNLGVVSSLVDEWNNHLPNIRPYYAVKCHPEPTFIVALAALGVGFDCASQGEIETVLALGVPSSQIVYANPCKQEAHIKYAASVGVNLTTYDSFCEIEKIKRWHPKCALLIRIKAGEDGDARSPLGAKYGAVPEEFTSLLHAANMAELLVVGVSFHVGSANTYSRAYRSAICTAKQVFDTALQLGMQKMRILDIGGGFFWGPRFENAAITIKEALKFYFGNETDLQVIAEPGRFFAETSFTLAACIIGKRVRGDLREYWINDGIYGSMNCVINDTVTMTAIPLAWISDPANPSCNGAKIFPSTVFGPTGDALDAILWNYQLPDLEVNDWLVFPDMGAYSRGCGTKFNGFDTFAIPTYFTYQERDS